MLNRPAETRQSDEPQVEKTTSDTVWLNILTGLAINIPRLFPKRMSTANGPMGIVGSSDESSDRKCQNVLTHSTARPLSRRGDVRKLNEIKKS